VSATTFSDQKAEPALTDERLRCWLDGNQAARERLCCALLALDPRFRDVRPRHPKGGPDGGRDLEAITDNGRKVWGAVGFRNHASDSSADIRWVRTKFRQDIDSALKNDPGLSAFVFMTNVEVSASERQELIEYAHQRRVVLSDIFTRERLRILLDSPDGLGHRFQFLRIPMSDAEQAAFFARWGEVIEQAIHNNFSTVNKRLDRIEFVQEMARPLRFLELTLFLKRRVSLADIGHFRVLFRITSMSGKSHDRIELTINDLPLNPSPKDSRALRGDFVESKTWITPAKGRRFDAKGGGLSGIDGGTIQIRAHSGFAFFESTATLIPTLSDFHGNVWSLFITKPFCELVERVRLIANHYEIVSVPNFEFEIKEVIDSDIIRHLWPTRLRPVRKVTSWMEIVPSPPSEHWIDFRKTTPLRIDKPPSQDFILRSIE
jgi:hypothetical protein